MSRAETAQVLSRTAGMVSVAPCQKGSILLAGMVTVAKDLSAAKEIEPTVSILLVPCASHMSSPEQRKHAKARKKAAWNIQWLCWEGQTVGRAQRSWWSRGRVRASLAMGRGSPTTRLRPCTALARHLELKKTVERLRSMCQDLMMVRSHLMKPYVLLVVC